MTRQIKCGGYTKEYYLAITTSEVLIYATTWMNPENIILIERQTKKPHTSRIGKSTETEISEKCQKLRRKENGK